MLEDIGEHGEACCRFEVKRDRNPFDKVIKQIQDPRLGAGANEVLRWVALCAESHSVPKSDPAL